MNSEIPQAIADWSELLESDQVMTEPAQLQQYGLNCLPTSETPIAVVYLQSVEEIQDALRIAAKHRVAVYPISRGRNWGYGGAAPSSIDTVVFDLSRMNKIVEFNEELAYVVVEPGVTQQQLYDYLKEKDIPLEMDVTGAPPDASLLGNILERGYGQTPYSDHFQHSSFMEVILADSTVLKTGFGHFESAKTACLHKWGLGPYIDGLFTQSNYGIVTKVGIWLMPRPEYFGVFFFRIANDAVLGQIFERMRKLRLQGTLRSAVHFGNDIRVLSSLQTYPWEVLDGKTPLPEDKKQQLLHSWGIGPWSCAGGLRGTRSEVRVRLRVLRKELRGLAKVRFISDRTQRLLRASKGIYEKLFSIDLEQKFAIFGLMRGIPTERPTKGLYWRKRGKVPENNYNPPKDGCGTIWLAPVAPSTDSDVRSLVDVTRTTCSEFNFETSISLNLITERSFCAVIGIHFDRENAEEAKTAAACHAKLLSRCNEKGYYPYRFGSQIAEDHQQLFEARDPFWQFANRLKQALDPLGILAPGRYGIGTRKSSGD